MRKLKHLPIEQWPVDDVLWSFLMPFRVTNRSNPQLDRWLRSTTEVSAEQHREAWGTGSVAPASEESAGGAIRDDTYSIPGMFLILMPSRNIC